MKRPFILLLAHISFLLVANSGFANPISQTEALRRASQFMPGKHFSSRNYSVGGGPSQTKPPFYIFNADDGGFVLVSGDDRTMPVLGYSEHGSLDLTNAPSNLRYWLDCYAEQIQNLDRGGNAVVSAPIMKRSAAISPLIQTRWNQSAPYHNQCPTAPGTSEICLTGCVATCMAQIMYYYKWPEHCPALPSYTPFGFPAPLPELPPIDFDWNDMKLSYTYGEEGVAADAVAWLMRYCGQAVKMGYGLDGSSGWLNPEVMKETFDYSETTTTVYRNDYGAEAWEALIYGELAQGRPVPYSGQSDGGGHQFICDGYDGKGYFHINWGWGGYLDSYFLLSVVNPEPERNSGYSQQQDAIIGLEPKTVPSDYMVNAFTVSEDVLINEETEIRVSLTNNGKTSRERLFLWMNQGGTWTLVATVNGTVGAGQTGEETLAFVPSATGTFDVKLSSDTEGNVVKATATIQVAEPVEKTVGDFVYLCNTVSHHAFVKGLSDDSKAINLTIPETFESDGATYTVLTVKDEAFYYSYRVRRLELPSTLTKIGKDAFFNCRNLEMVVSHIVHPFVIDDNTFVCRSWNSDSQQYDYETPSAVLYVPVGSKAEYEAISGWTKFAKIAEGEPKEVVASGLKFFCLPDTKTASVIADEGYKELTEVDIPAKVECDGASFTVDAIANEAFESCYNISSVTFPSTLRSIGYDAFWNCYSIEELDIPEGCESISSTAFAYCFRLKKVVLPSTLSSIGERAFANASSMVSVISRIKSPCAISQDVFSISDWNQEKQDYDYEPSPATLYVPVGTKAAYIAKGWDQFTSMKEGEPVEAVIAGLRYQVLTTEKTAIVLADESYKELTEVNIPMQVEWGGTKCNVVAISDRAFASCYEITTLTLPPTLKSIGNSAFWNCYRIKELSIPEGCETIGSSAFAYCFWLQKLVLPYTLTSIGDFAFRDISSLVSVISCVKTPFAISESVFSISSWNEAKQEYDFEDSPATLYIPVGKKSAYIAKGWDQFAAIVEDDASGIDEITTNQRTDDGAIYNLNGQRVENPTKGVYIRNGKKILFR